MTTGSETESSCPQCGGPTEVRQKGFTRGLYCTRCDWAVVHTEIPQINLDTTLYEVRIRDGDYGNREHVKVVADISGVNFLEARRLLQQREPVVFRGQAIDVVPVRESLKSAGILFTISPEFRW
jgi:hypothetical protein